MFQTSSAEKSLPEVTHFRVAFKVGERLSTLNQRELMLFLMEHGVSNIQLNRRGLNGTCAHATFEEKIQGMVQYAGLSDDLISKVESVYIPKQPPFFG